MTPNIPQAVRELIAEYRRFLRTSYRFLDERLRRQFEEHLDRTDVIVRGPYVTLAREFERGGTLREIVADGGLAPDLLRARWPFGEERLFRHQEEALIAGRAGRSFVVTTGTGSGKTEAFLLPVLDGILRRKRDGVTGLQAILLYPMNALANDQLERLRRLLRGSGLDLSFALYTGDSDAAAQSLGEAPAETERTTRARIRSDPPDLLLTNYKQLEFLLVRREDRRLFTRSLRYLVLDEIHSYRGALATEIACLIRRLEAHAGLRPGELVAIGTSATVAAKEGGSEALAAFATTLFGQTVAPEDIIGERYAARRDEGASWTPARPDLDDAALRDLDPGNDASVVTLAERLTGRRCPARGHVADRVATVLEGNRVVHALEAIFAEPCSLDAAAEALRHQVAERADVRLDEVRREIEAYLLVGSVGDEDHPPRLRPKLHTFFHGVYDVALCLDPDCRALVPQGGAECARCGSVARPAALCRTCGQDFVKVRFEREDDDRPVGTGDFYSDESTAFLTHEIRELPEGPGAEDEEAEEAADGEPASRRRPRRANDERLAPTGVCLGCGRLMAEGGVCPTCNRRAIPMLMHRGKLSTCPACGDIYTRGDIVTPLRTGTASTVSVLATHHLDRLDGADRKLLVFADNRQDVAHQAGYTADKHRSFALRHAVARAVRDAGDRSVYLEELPERIFDHYRDLGIVPRRPTRPERERWLDALTYEVANEFTR
ncbi:MAG: DEAD/DEAH box helicase, partial [Armatimonadota bacterium]|nr:DEAD/DEAH box helicase [Armatimonadota bacterium]